MIRLAAGRREMTKHLGSTQELVHFGAKLI